MFSLLISFSLSSIFHRPVTYYSMVKFEHNLTKRWLSASILAFESGSHQMLTRSSTKKHLAESLWTIIPVNTTAYPDPRSTPEQLKEAALKNQVIHQGDKVRCNDTIQLFHATSGGYLHSHSFWSFLGRGYEVTSFNDVDDGNFWNVRCIGEGAEYPVFGHHIRLQHRNNRCSVATDAKGQLPPESGGEFELYCSLNTMGSELVWKIAEGIFVDQEAQGEIDEKDEL